MGGDGSARCLRPVSPSACGRRGSQPAQLLLGQLRRRSGLLTPVSSACPGVCLSRLGPPVSESEPMPLGSAWRLAVGSRLKTEPLDSLVSRETLGRRPVFFVSGARWRAPLRLGWFIFSLLPMAISFIRLFVSRANLVSCPCPYLALFLLRPRQADGLYKTRLPLSTRPSPVLFTFAFPILPGPGSACCVTVVKNKKKKITW